MDSRCAASRTAPRITCPSRTTRCCARLGSSLEKKRLLLSTFPQAVAERLKRGDREVADSFTEVTVLFADLEGFTERPASVAPAELVRWLYRIFSVFDRLA